MAGGPSTFRDDDFPPLPHPKVSPQPSIVDAFGQPFKADLMIGALPIHTTNPTLMNSKTTAQQPPSSSPMEVSKIAKAFSGNLEIRPLHQINGTPCVSFKVQDKVHLLSKIKYVIVAKFSHGRPRFIDFQLFLSNMRLKGDYKISEFDNKHVFVEFHIFEDFVKIWLEKSRLINGFRVRFFQWGGDFNPAVESSVAPIWIHLPALPLYMFDEEVIISIASLFGKLLYIDPRNLEKRRVGHLSFCVARDVRTKRLDGFWIEFVGEGKLVERFWQKVSYGTVPNFCASCLHLGHFDSECKLPQAVNQDYFRGISAGGSQILEDVPVLKVFGRLEEALGGHLHGSSPMNRKTKKDTLDVVLVEDGSCDEGGFCPDSIDSGIDGLKDSIPALAEKVSFPIQQVRESTALAGFGEVKEGEPSGFSSVLVEATALRVENGKGVIEGGLEVMVQSSARPLLETANSTFSSSPDLQSCEAVHSESHMAEKIQQKPLAEAPNFSVDPIVQKLATNNVQGDLTVQLKQSSPGDNNVKGDLKIQHQQLSPEPVFNQPSFQEDGPKYEDMLLKTGGPLSTPINHVGEDLALLSRKILDRMTPPKEIIQAYDFEDYIPEVVCTMYKEVLSGRKEDEAYLDRVASLYTNSLIDSYNMTHDKKITSPIPSTTVENEKVKRAAQQTPPKITSPERADEARNGQEMEYDGHLFGEECSSPKQRGRTPKKKDVTSPQGPRTRGRSKKK